MPKLPPSLTIPMNKIEGAPSKEPAKHGRAVRARETAPPAAPNTPSSKGRSPPSAPPRERHNALKTGYHRIR